MRFLAVLAPLGLFAGLAEEMREDGVLFFDLPALNAVHSLATPWADDAFRFLSRAGYLWGVLPFDVALLCWLLWRKRHVHGLFFGLAVLGSLTINVAAKAWFARTRPDLWLSLAPETSYSFPSGHAMGSATLAVAASLLAWHSRWRWPVVMLSGLFVILVGLSRVYLGVHYPSDILAGWAAAAAWVLLLHPLVVGRADSPPSAAGFPD